MGGDSPLAKKSVETIPVRAVPFLYINSWLKFLLEESLIEKTHLQTVISDLESLKPEYDDFYREKCPDPEILEAFQNWPETTGTEGK